MDVASFPGHRPAFYRAVSDKKLGVGLGTRLTAMVSLHLWSDNSRGVASNGVRRVVFKYIGM